MSSNSDKDPAANDIPPELENHPGREPLVNQNREMFALAYIKHVRTRDRGTAAAIDAGYSKRSAASTASNLLKQPTVKERVEYLGKLMLHRQAMGAHEAMAELASIARADMRRIIRNIGTHMVEVGTTKDGKPIIKPEYVIDFLPFEEMDTSIIKRVYMDRSGRPVIELHDKVSALDRVNRIHGLYKEPDDPKDALPKAKIGAETDAARAALDQSAAQSSAKKTQEKRPKSEQPKAQ